MTKECKVREGVWDILSFGLSLAGMIVFMLWMVGCKMEWGIILSMLSITIGVVLISIAVIRINKKVVM